MVYLITEQKNRVKNANTNHGQVIFEYCNDENPEFEIILRKRKNN